MRLSAVLAVAVLAGCGPITPSVMEFVEISPQQPRIGDVVTVRFRLLDERGIPQAGSKVDFRLLSDTAGVTLSPTSASSIRGSGYAETQVIATGRVNSIIVVATAGDKQVLSPPITFAGTVPNGRQFTFQCGPFAGKSSGGRHAIGVFDQTRNLIAGSRIECTAHVGDRNGDGVEGALVSFLTEAGTIGPSETSQAGVIGDATILYKATLPLPLDVGPETFSWTPTSGVTHTGAYVAPLWMHPYEWVQNPLALALVAPGSRTYTQQEPRRPDPIRLKPDGSGRFENNPRDNLVTLVAVTAGEEGFTDLNNDGICNPGEPYDDLPEPFVDMNDNGTHDDFEAFIDVDGDRNWDPKNDRWDTNTLIWVQERILWTGIPAVQDQLSVIPGVGGHRPTALAVTPASITLQCPGAVGSPCGQAVDPTNGGPAIITAYLADPWFNSMARNSDGDGCDIDIAGEAPVRLEFSSLKGSAFTYPAGDYVTFLVGDARDPNAPPADQIPKRSVPIRFGVPITCQFTSSPSDGFLTKFYMGTLSGQID